MKSAYTIIFLFVIALGLLMSFDAQSQNRANDIHNRIHREQLANVNSKMDKSVIADIIKNDIVVKKEKIASISEESLSMLSDLLSEANRHIGKPYSRGSKGPRAFDCSGFSSYVYRQFGINLSSSSGAQFGQGVAVNRNELRKGDLVFFTSRRSGKNVGHVGIVVSSDQTGNFKFIHASSSRGITVDNCAGYYEGRYLGARRIITE